MKTHHHLPTHPATRSSRRDFLALRTARRLLAVLGLLIAAAVAPTAIAANSPPTGITVNFANGGAFSLGVPGITIGTFVATDPDAGQTHTFTLVAGPGDTDNASLVITAPNTLKFAPTVSLELKNYSLRVRVTDNGTPAASADFVETLTFAPVVNPAQFTWTARDSARNWTVLSSSADGTKVVAVGGDTNGVARPKLYRSTDSGATWAALTGAQNQLWTGIASSADGTKLVACEQSSDIANFQGGRIWTSINSGATWTQRLTAGTNAWTSVASSTDGTKLVAIVNFGKVYVSTDSGANWTARSTDASDATVTRGWGAVAVSPNGNLILAADNTGPSLTGGLIYSSSDNGATWTPLSAPAASWNAVASSADGSKLVAAAIDGQVYTSGDSGTTWTPRTIAGALNKWGAVAVSSDGSRMIAADGWWYNSGKVYVSTDSGANWTAQTAAGTRNWTSLASSSDGYKLVAGVFGGQVFTGVEPPPTPAPGITNVTGPAAGTYKAGDMLNFTVSFNAPVTVTGSPQLPLTIGATGGAATYASGSGGSALVFTYSNSLSR